MSNRDNLAVLLACLYYEVHSRFYRLDEDTYFDAMDEVGIMAHACGYSINDLAKIVTYV
jgi:hypothetical protein